MGVSLEYRTTAAVPQSVKDAIESDAQQFRPTHGWWAEAMNFFDTGEGNGRLYGDTKIFLVGYSTNDGGYADVDPDDDSLMAYRDTCFILDHLADWSRQHAVGWELACAGEPIGTIRQGQQDSQLKEYVAGMKSSFTWPAKFEDRIREITSSHEKRG